MSHTSSTRRLAIHAGAAGVLVLLVLAGSCALGGDDTLPDQVGVAGHGIDPIHIDDPQNAPENRLQLLNDIDTRAPIMETTNENARFVEAPTRGCVFDPRYLPHTPDAVEGWYRSCRFVVRRDSECQLDPNYLPRTPDAVEGWNRSCLSRQ